MKLENEKNNNNIFIETKNKRFDFYSKILKLLNKHTENLFNFKYLNNYLKLFLVYAENLIFEKTEFENLKRVSFLIYEPELLWYKIQDIKKYLDENFLNMTKNKKEYFKLIYLKEVFFPSEKTFKEEIELLIDLIKYSDNFEKFSKRLNFWYLFYIEEYRKFYNKKYFKRKRNITELFNGFFITIDSFISYIFTFTRLNPILIKNYLEKELNVEFLRQEKYRINNTIKKIILNFTSSEDDKLALLFLDKYFENILPISMNFKFDDTKFLLKRFPLKFTITTLMFNNSELSHIKSKIKSPRFSVDIFDISNVSDCFSKIHQELFFSKEDYFNRFKFKFNFFPLDYLLDTMNNVQDIIKSFANNNKIIEKMLIKSFNFLSEETINKKYDELNNDEKILKKLNLIFNDSSEKLKNIYLLEYVFKNKIKNSFLEFFIIFANNFNFDYIKNENEYIEYFFKKIKYRLPYFLVDVAKFFSINELKIMPLLYKTIHIKKYNCSDNFIEFTIRSIKEHFFQHKKWKLYLYYVFKILEKIINNKTFFNYLFYVDFNSNGEEQIIAIGYVLNYVDGYYWMSKKEINLNYILENLIYDKRKENIYKRALDSILYIFESLKLFSDKKIDIKEIFYFVSHLYDKSIAIKMLRNIIPIYDIRKNTIIKNIHNCLTENSLDYKKFLHSQELSYIDKFLCK